MRLQFSVRSGALGIAVVAALTAWTLSVLEWKKQRHEWIDTNRHVLGYQVLASVDGQAPGVLWMFGERGYDGLRIMFAGLPREDQLSAEQRHTLEMIRELFPEATVEVIPPYTGKPL